MVDAFFKFLNFGIFIGLGVYVWRKNLQNFFQAQIVKKRVKNEDLAREEYAILRTQKAVELQKKDQHLLYEDLRQKILEWQKVQAKERHALEEMRAHYHHALSQRIALEMRSYRNRHAKKLLIQRVLEESRRELTHTFQNPQKNEAYTRSSVALFAHTKDT